MSQTPPERPIPTRRAFLVGLIGLAALAPAGCSSDSGGDFGQQFERPKDANAAAAAPQAESPVPSRRRSQEIREDREKARQKAAGKAR